MNRSKRQPATICLLAGLVMLLAGCTATRFSVSFNRIYGLRQGDPVLFRDTPVGRVHKVTYTETGVFLVEIELEQAFAHAATEHSRFMITDAPGRTGDKAVLIRQSEPGGEKIAGGAVVEGSEPDDTAAAMEDAGAVISESLAVLMKIMEQGLSDLGVMLQTLPETQEYQVLMKALSDLEARLKTSGAEMAETLRRDVLPFLEEKIRELAERLKQQGQEDKARNLEQELERLQQI